MTASNSDMRKVGSTFIQIKLVVDKGGNVGKQDIHMGEFVGRRRWCNFL